MKPSAQLYLRRNEAKVCNHPGCHNFRYSMNSYCRLHRRDGHRIRVYGWSEGKALTKKVLEPYRKEVRELVKRNLSHEAVRSNILFLDNWLENASMGLRVSLIDEMAELRSRGVSGQDVFEVSAAIVHLSYSDPYLLPPERKPLIIAIGRGVLQLKKNVAIPRMSPIRVCGETIYNEMGGTLLRIHREIVSRHEREKAKRAKMALPFDWSG